MNREEAIEMWVIPALKNTWNEKKCDEILKALKQEPCEDEYIKVPKKALKYRTAGMVAYNAEWLKNHFDIERAVICGAQEPCDDCVSRDAVLEALYDHEYKKDIRKDIEALPSVQPAEKAGHWIDKSIPDMASFICTQCERRSFFRTNFCPNCGAKMSASPTSCSTCILDRTDACTRGAGRAVDDEACEDYLASPTGSEGSEE